MSASNLRFDAEYQRMLECRPLGPRPTMETIHQTREFYENLYRHRLDALPKVDDIKHSSNFILTHDAKDIEFHHFSNEKIASATTPQPAVLYFHGGGMICGSVEIYKPLLSHYVSLSGIPFFAVDYRVAPENPAPAGVEDAYTALKHLVENASQWNIDPSRICLMGDSSGGLLATASALMARDRELTPKVAMQLLVYPMLDNRTTLSTDAPLWPFMSYKPSRNTVAWEAFLEGGEVSRYTVPAIAEDVGGLPNTYIEVGSLDLFLKEDVAYASRLAEAGVEVELRVWAGVPHGFELAFGLEVSRRAFDSRIHALRRL